MHQQDNLTTDSDLPTREKRIRLSERKQLTYVDINPRNRTHLCC